MTYQEIISGWRQKAADTEDKLDQALSSFRIIFAYHSGVIENQDITYHNTREIFENGRVINYTGDLRTLYEIQNQKLCHEFLRPLIIKKEPVTAQLVRNVHRELMQGTYDERRWSQGERPGRFRVNDYVVADGQGALPGEVEAEVDELCGELLNVQDKNENILKAAAYLHCRFENIHPFADGNGRTGRTMMNYYLLIHDYPPLVIYNDSKGRYYEALGHYDKTGDILPFLDYMKQSLEKTWERKRTNRMTIDQYIDREP